jgi:hypothetical protein
METDEKQEDAIGTRGIITLAYGKRRYIDMAAALGRSLKLHAPHLERGIVTDSSDIQLAKLFTKLIPFRPEYGSNLRQKLHLDLYAPFEETLFIDSDCFALGNLDTFWKAFSGTCYFGVPGWRELSETDTDPYVDVSFVMKRFGINKLPKFNGGTYYLLRSERTSALFNTARTLMRDWKDLRFREFCLDGPSDEPIIGVAMAIHGLTATPMGVGGMWTPGGSKGPMHVDVLKGECSFEKEGRMVYPEVIHFPGRFSSSFIYHRESLRLQEYFGGGRATALQTCKVWLEGGLAQCIKSARLRLAR